MPSGEEKYHWVVWEKGTDGIVGFETYERKEQVEDIFNGYGPKTLVSGWSYASTIYPLDNVPNSRNQRSSSYNRLGGYDFPTPQSVSRSDQEKVWTIPRTVESRRHLINLVTYPFTEGEARSSKVEKAGLQYPPPSFGATDYLTTHQKSYVAYAPLVFNTAKSLVDEFKPETKFRRKIANPYDWRRPGLGKFYDDNIDFVVDNNRTRCEPPPYGVVYQPKEWDKSK